MRMHVETVSRPIRGILATHGQVWGTRFGQAALADMVKILRDDKQDEALRGVDRMNRPYEPLRAERRGKYKGATGRPLDPFGAASRVYANFRAFWIGFGSAGVNWEIIMGWRDFEILKYHVKGPDHNPRLPVRDPRGVAIGTHSKLRARVRAMLAEIRGAA